MKKAGMAALAAGGAAFFCLFLLFPLAGVFRRAFFFTETFSFDLFLLTLTSPMVVRAILNSLLLGGLTVVFAVALSLPAAALASAYDFPLKRYLTGVVLVPLVLPPFVGAIGMERMFGRYGLFNQILGLAPSNWFAEGGLVMAALLMALHLFPIIYLNLTAALSNVDPRLREAAAVAGASRARVFQDITLPLALPGFLAGGLIVFLWSMTDVGTPLVLNVRQVLAVEVFDRTAAVNNDPAGSVLVVVILIITLCFMFLARGPLSREAGASAVKEARAEALPRPAAPVLALIYACFGGLFLLAVIPHAGVLLTALAKEWFMTPLPSEWTLRYFGETVGSQGVLDAVKNSLFYSVGSTALDVALGLFLAYYVVRKSVRLGWIIDGVVMLPIALPGLVLAFGYVAAFSGTFLDPMKNPVPLLIIGYAVRRLPYVFRSAYAGFQQVGPQFEEAARVCGAGPLKAFSSTTLPLIFGSILGGGVLAFMFAMLEVSESLILAVKEEFYPLTRAIYYLIGKIPDGDASAAALGVFCMVFLAICLFVVSSLLGKRMGRLFRM